MMQIPRLKSLCSQPDSCISMVRQPVHLALQPGYLGHINAGIFGFLNNKLHNYYPELKGILMGYDKIKMKKKTGNILNDNPFIHVDIQADFFVFTPKLGCQLRGRVNKKSSGHVGCLVHQTFNASISPEPGHDLSTWCGKRVEIGQQIEFTISSVCYGEKMPIIQGRLREAGLDVAQEEVEEAVVEVEEFEEPLMPDYDSGIDSIGSGSKKSKEERTEEDEEERRKKRKEEKKKRKMKEREEQSEMEGPAKKKKKHNQADEVDTALGLADKSFELTVTRGSVSEVGDKEQKTADNPVESVTTKSVKTPRKKSKEAFVLPEDWVMKERVTDKSKYKEYFSPNGKRFTSLVKVQKFLEESKGQGEQTVNQVIDEKTKEIQLSEYDKMISYVATLWNTDIDGDLLADQPSFYRNPNLKDFPNDTVYFEPGSPPISKKATKPKAKPKTPPNPEPSIIKTPPKATETVSADHTQNSVDHTQTTFMGDISHISKSDFESGSASFSASGFDGNESSKKKKKKNKKEKHEARDAVENTVNAEEMTHVNKEKKKKKKKNKEKDKQREDGF